MWRLSKRDVRTTPTSSPTTRGHGTFNNLPAVLSYDGKFQLILINYPPEMDILRDAGYNEKRCIIRDVLSYYGSIITFGTYVNPSSRSRKIPQGDIIKALKACLVQHPALYTSIQDSDSEHPQLVREWSIDLEQHIRIVNDTSIEAEDLQKLLESIHNDALPASQDRPQWRVHIAPLLSVGSGFLLAFVSSHNIFDGKSGMIFHRCFLKELRNVSKSKFNSEPHWQSSLDNTLPPPLENAGRLTISWSFLLGPLVNEYLPASLVTMLGMEQSQAENAWCGASDRPLKPEDENLVHSAVRVSLIPSVVVDRALMACRNHQARLTGLLNHLFSVALARQLKARNQQYSEFVTETALDMRTPLDAEYSSVMANYVSVANETFRVMSHQVATMQMDEDAWTAARASTARLSKASMTLHDQPVGLLRYLSNYRQWTMKKAAKQTTISFSISNLGVLTAPSVAANRDGWTIDDLGFSQSADATGAVININVASAKGGNLIIVASWWPGMLGVTDEDTFIEEVCADVKKMLNTVE